MNIDRIDCMFLLVWAIFVLAYWYVFGFASTLIILASSLIGVFLGFILAKIDSRCRKCDRKQIGRCRKNT